ncbi:MAG: NTP transferase domain-containing protein, partial [Rhizobiaceae bacterium]
MNVGVVSTRLPHLKESVMDKTMRVLQGRLAASGSIISREIRTSHSEEDIISATENLIADNDMVLIFGASAICDIDDYIPAAIRKLGGRIEHFGMPVDPGNLLLVGELKGKPVIGAPGCARSPAENGFDWILDRLLAGREISADEITGMGVGGLLMEIGTRPRPREASKLETGKTAAIILAAGQSRRMGEANKLAAIFNGKPLVRQVTEAAAASEADEVIVVTGHEADVVRSVLTGLDVRFVDNPAYEEGLSTSLAAGVSAVGKGFDRAIILLADMPQITTQMIDHLIATSRSSPPGSIILSTFKGKRGNPVLWPLEFFEQLAQISGDVGARHLIGENAGRVVQVELGEAAGFDIDTQEALLAAGGNLADDR